MEKKIVCGYQHLQGMSEACLCDLNKVVDRLLCDWQITNTFLRKSLLCAVQSFMAQHSDCYQAFKHNNLIKSNKTFLGALFHTDT